MKRKTNLKCVKKWETWFKLSPKEKYETRIRNKQFMKFLFESTEEQRKEYMDMNTDRLIKSVGKDKYEEIVNDALSHIFDKKGLH